MTTHPQETATPETCTPAWAHSAGVIDLQPVSPVPTDLAVIADRSLITETVARYAIAYDERRLEVLRSLMRENVTYEYRIGEGPLTGRSGRDEVIAWFDDIMRSQHDQRRHLVSSLVVERLTPRQATVVAYKSIVGVAEQAQLVTTGLYRFSLIKDRDRWLIETLTDALDRPF